MNDTIAEKILPMMAESTMAVQELNDLLWHATDVALTQFRELAGEAESMDKAELADKRQLLRKPNTQDARSKLQRAHDKQYSVFTMMDAERDVENLLRDDKKRLEQPVQKPAARCQPEL